MPPGKYHHRDRKVRLQDATRHFRLALAADGFTKGLLKEKHKAFVRQLNVAYLSDFRMSGGSCPIWV